MFMLTEKQRRDAIAGCEGIEGALARQQIALENIAKIFDNIAKGKDPRDGLRTYGVD